MYTCTVLYLFMDIGQFLYTSLVPRLHPLLCESEFKGHAIMRARGEPGNEATCILHVHVHIFYRG